MGWRPSLPAPSSPKSFLPLSVSSPAVQYRRRSGEAPTSSFSMHKLAFCWVMDHWVGSRRQAGDPACSSEIHPEYQDQAALAAPAALDQVPSLGRMLKPGTKRPSAIIEAHEHSLNPWCAAFQMLSVVRGLFGLDTGGIFYVEHMDGCLKELGFQ